MIKVNYMQFVSAHPIWIPSSGGVFLSMEKCKTMGRAWWVNRSGVLVKILTQVHDSSVGNSYDDVNV